MIGPDSNWYWYLAVLIVVPSVYFVGTLYDGKPEEEKDILGEA